MLISEKEWLSQTAEGTEWENAKRNHQYLKIKTDLEKTQLSLSHAL